MRADPVRFNNIVWKHPSPVVEDRYRHWSRLRHLKPPEGLTHEDWWWGLKVARLQVQKGLLWIPVRGAQVHTVASCDPLSRLTHAVDRCLGGLIPPESEILNPATRDRYLTDSLIEESITSSQLEGASTSRLVAEDLLRTGRRPRDPGETMIANNYRAMRFVREHSREPLTEHRLLALHRIVSENTLDDPRDAGRYRTDDSTRVFGPDGEVDHVPPPFREVPERMSRLLDLANGEEPPGWFLHPVVRSILVHYAVGFHHPFVDGNGRTARALFYWTMLRQGYALTEFLSVSNILRKAPAQYARAYQYTESDAGDTTYFVLFHLEVILRAHRALMDYLGRRRAELRDLTRMVHSSGRFNHRQLALLATALRDPEAEFTYRSHGTTHQVVFDTARRDLSALFRGGLLRMEKRGREHFYRPTPDLERRLRAREPGNR